MKKYLKTNFFVWVSDFRVNEINIYLVSFYTRKRERGHKLVIIRNSNNHRVAKERLSHEHPNPNPNTPHATISNNKSHRNNILNRLKSLALSTAVIIIRFQETLSLSIAHMSSDL